MPEGHTIHRYARKHREALGSERVVAGSPQGRFAGGAARIDGLRLEGVSAHGKHLFYHWEGVETLHVHLGLFGRFRTYRANPPPPTDGTRLTLSTNDVAIYLSGPTVCELIDSAREKQLRSRLGPDPLRATTESAADFAANLSRRRISIGAALLDQRVIAGIGNVYRAEVLFLAGIDPTIPAQAMPAGPVARVWSLSTSLLEAGEQAGRIVTVHPSDLPADGEGEPGRDDRLYVYKRQGEPCRRCGTLIRRDIMANRKIWWCPTCQAA